MNILEIITQNDSGELANATDPVLLAAQNKLDLTVSEMRTNKVSRIPQEIVHPGTGQLVDVWIRIDRIESASAKISTLLNTRYGCND